MKRFEKTHNAMYKKMINIMDECHQCKTEMGYSKL